VKIEIAMPEGVVIPQVLAEPVAGWNVTVQTTPLETPIETDDGIFTEAVSVVTFEGGQIKPGEFQLFNLAVGPLPNAAGTTLLFPAVQTYSDGQEVRWVDVTQAGQPEPEHPAPALHLVSVSATGAAPSDDSDSDTLAIVAIVIGAVGVALGGIALFFARRTSSSTP
jgi:periplasmic copper chaperone A